MKRKSLGQRKKEVKEKEDRIFNCLLFAREPKTVYAISKETAINPSSIFNYLKKLHEKGVVIKVNGKYLLQPLFYEQNFWKELEDYLIPLLSLIKDYSVDNPDLLSILYYLCKIILDSNSTTVSEKKGKRRSTDFSSTP